MGPVLIGADRLDRRRRRQLRSSPVAGHGPVVPEHRLWVVHDTNGPRIRLGVAWAGLAVVAVALGPLPAAMLFAVVAGVAATQTGAALRRDGEPAQPVVAGVAAAAIVLLAAAPSSRLVGAAILAAVAASFAVTRAGPSVDAAGATVRAWLFAGLAGAAVVIVSAADRSVAVLLVALVCTYDVGDYLVGSAARHPLEGPLAGGVGVLVVTFGVAVVRPVDLDADRLWLLGFLTAVCCPLGQLLASAALPRARAFAPALRRLDALLLAGPLWVLLAL